MMPENEQSYDDTASLPYYDHAPKTQKAESQNTVSTAPEQGETSVSSPDDNRSSETQKAESQNTVSTASEQGEPVISPPAKTRRSRGTWLSSLVAVLGTVLIIAAGTLFYFAWPGFHPTPKPTPGPAPSSFHSSVCPFPLGKGIIEGQQVKCGILRVPEDRRRPQGMTVQLAVAIFKSPKASASADPVVYLAGGPGGSALGYLGTIGQNDLDKVTLGHDLILLDQRGVGYSNPTLDCPEFVNVESSGPAKNFGQDSQVQAAQACHDRLMTSGINLNAYTTIDNATDVHDLIHALGYTHVNLYGVSYGTRLALTIMRLFPADIRSVVLDSIFPTQESLYIDFPAVIQHSFDVFFRGCAANAHCHATYPHLESDFYSLVTSLNNHPATLQLPQTDRSVTFDGNVLVNWIHTFLYSGAFIPNLPSAIMQIRSGDYHLVQNYYIPVALSTYSGMFFSIECGEDMAFTTLQEMTQSAQVLRPEIRPGILTQLQTAFTICKNWGEKPVPVKQKQPVTSSLPTLILSGEYDPITPTTNAEAAMRTLSRSFLFVFPGTGHGVMSTDTCPDSIISAFLENPGRKPDAGCIAHMSEPKFQ